MHLFNVNQISVTYYRVMHPGVSEGKLLNLIFSYELLILAQEMGPNFGSPCITQYQISEKSAGTGIG